MDTHDENERIDSFLKMISKQSKASTSTLGVHVNSELYEPIFERMLGEKLVKVTDSSYQTNYFSLTRKGRRIVAQGGYIKFFERKAQKKQGLEEREKIELALAKSNLEANQFQTRMARKANKQAKWAIFLTAANLAFFIYQLFGT